MAPSPQTAELLRRNRTRFPDMDIRFRKPFGYLHNELCRRLNSHPGAETATEIVRDWTRQSIDYTDWGCNSGRLAGEVEAEIRNRAKVQRKVHFLDMGPGHGDGLKLAESIAPNVYSHALGLNYLEADAYCSRGRQIRRHFESTVVKKKGSREGYFDIIQSFYGLHYSTNKAVAFENALNSLRYGGKLFNYPKPEAFQERMLPLLESQGFTIENKKLKDDTTIQIITRKPGAIADLREHYDAGPDINMVPIKRSLPSAYAPKMKPSKGIPNRIKLPKYRRSKPYVILTSQQSTNIQRLVHEVNTQRKSTDVRITAKPVFKAATTRGNRLDQSNVDAAVHAMPASAAQIHGIRKKMESIRTLHERIQATLHKENDFVSERLRDADAMGKIPIPEELAQTHPHLFIDENDNLVFMPKGSNIKLAIERKSTP